MTQALVIVQLRSLSLGIACWSLSACDFAVTLRARVPVLAPVRAACLPPGASELVDPDSARFIQTSRQLVNQRPEREKADSITRSLVRNALDLRSARASGSPTPGRGVAIRSDAPRFEAWQLASGHGRTWLRITGDSVRWVGTIQGSPRSYLIAVDTLASPSDTFSPIWLTAHELRIPKPAKGHELAGDCARSDSLHGHFIAIVRSESRTTRRPAVDAWQLDVATLRLVSASTANVWCRTPNWPWDKLN